MVAFTASAVAASVVLPALASASVFALAAVTIPITSYQMGYNYLRGTSQGFNDFVNNNQGSQPLFTQRYKHWWF